MFPVKVFTRLIYCNAAFTGRKMCMCRDMVFLVLFQILLSCLASQHHWWTNDAFVGAINSDRPSVWGCLCKPLVVVFAHPLKQLHAHNSEWNGICQYGALSTLSREQLSLQSMTSITLRQIHTAQGALPLEGIGSRANTTRTAAVTVNISDNAYTRWQNARTCSSPCERRWSNNTDRQNMLEYSRKTLRNGKQ